MARRTLRRGIVAVTLQEAAVTRSTDAALEATAVMWQGGGTTVAKRGILAVDGSRFAKPPKFGVSTAETLTAQNGDIGG